VGEVVYYGELKTTIDDKSRVTIPSRMRQTMRVLKHSDWYMTCGYDGCIFLYPEQEWQRVLEHFNQFGPLDPRALDFRRLLFSSVSEAVLDGQGRMQLVPYLREHAGLEPRQEAVIIGVGRHIEIWSVPAWRAFREQREAQLKELAGDISPPRLGQGRAVAAIGDDTDNTSNVPSEGERART